jgi:acetyl-CoA carboxylase carboxyl transferase subunit alpha
MSLELQPPPTEPVELSAWDRVQLARHPQRPYALDYIKWLFSEFIELHGDRRFADDPAIVGGPAALDGQTVMVIGQQKGRDTKENALRRFGMPRPEGYRKALRLMRHAEKFGFPVLALIDTPGADPTLPSEERGQAFAIAENLLAMAGLRVPYVAVVIGEGGSGGALALALADRVLMLENSIYSVASPEASASILWRDSAYKAEAAAAMKITAPDLYRFRVIDAVVPEPPGGAHTDHRAAALLLKQAVLEQFAALARCYGAGDRLDVDRLLADRYARYRRIGVLAE